MGCNRWHHPGHDRCWYSVFGLDWDLPLDEIGHAIMQDINFIVISYEIGMED